MLPALLSLRSQILGPWPLTMASGYTVSAQAHDGAAGGGRVSAVGGAAVGGLAMAERPPDGRFLGGAQSADGGRSEGDERRATGGDPGGSWAVIGASAIRSGGEGRAAIQFGGQGRMAKAALGFESTCSPPALPLVRMVSGARGRLWNGRRDPRGGPSIGVALSAWGPTGAIHSDGHASEKGAAKARRHRASR